MTVRVKKQVKNTRKVITRRNAGTLATGDKDELAQKTGNKQTI